MAGRRFKVSVRLDFYSDDPEILHLVGCTISELARAAVEDGLCVDGSVQLREKGESAPTVKAPTVNAKGGGSCN